MEQLRLHALIKGRVQGVGFRFFVLDTAQQLGATGWVRNRWDGSVEVTAEGGRTPLEQLLAALHSGPRMAHVSQVKYEWEAASGEFRDFQARSTQ